MNGTLISTWTFVQHRLFTSGCLFLLIVPYAQRPSETQVQEVETDWLSVVNGLGRKMQDRSVAPGICLTSSYEVLKINIYHLLFDRFVCPFVPHGISRSFDGLGCYQIWGTSNEHCTNTVGRCDAIDLRMILTLLSTLKWPAYQKDHTGQSIQW